MALEALAWAAMVAGNAAGWLIRDGWQNPRAIIAVVAIYGVGALVASPLAAVAATLVSRGSRTETRFAAHVVALLVFTVGVTSAIYALEHRIYFARWHDDPFTIVWVFQFISTTAGALYHFSVIGLRLYLPFGLAALVVIGLWRTARPR